MDTIHQVPFGRPRGRRRARAAIGMLGFALVSILGVAAPSMAGAATYPPSSETLTPSTSTVAPGSPVVFTATGFQSGSTVTFTVGGTAPTGVQSLAAVSPSAVITIGTGIADGSGTASVTWNVPSDWPTGPVTAYASGRNTAGDPAVVTTSVTIQASGGGGGGGGGLPYTGSSSSSLVRIALIALAIGAAAVVVARRRAGAEDGRESRRAREDETVGH